VTSTTAEPPKTSTTAAAASQVSTTLPTATPSVPAANSLSPQQSAAQNPLRAAPASTAASAQEPDRYAAASSPTASTAATTAPLTPSSTSAEASFADSWPAIQAALDRRDLKLAHQLLSKWHGSDALTPSDAERVQTLLSQLAGTVIYSTEHQLESPRVVKAGETLETIAKEYNVPWQLLAKINGIPAPDKIQPGQQLKVVRGPFAATVDLRRNEVALSVDNRYAGRFPIAVPLGANVTDGEWVVDQKLAGPPSTANPNTIATTPIPADRTIILRNVNAPAGAPTLLIASGPAPAATPAGPPSLRVSPQDAEELSDILSIGSRVTVRR
jgi:LysM repeat protein